MRPKMKLYLKRHVERIEKAPVFAEAKEKAKIRSQRMKAAADLSRQNLRAEVSQRQITVKVVNSETLQDKEQKTDRHR